MADKNKDVVTREVIEKATQDMLQTVVEHLYDYEPYSDEFISDLFKLTPDEVKSMSEIINDEVVSKYKLWSSQGTTNKINEAKLECQNYSNELIKDLSSISLAWCETSLPAIGEVNKIYVLPVISGGKTVNTLNIWNSTTSTYVSIGNLDIDLTTLYTKTEIDTMLADYAKKTEVLSIDNVITDISKATGTNVLSANTSISELDKKIDKTSIATTISSTSTDGEVPSAKTVYEKTKNMCTTTVTDVPLTNIAPSDTTTFVNFAGNSSCNYYVKNGVCYVSLWGVKIASTGSTIRPGVFLPKCANNRAGVLMTGTGDATCHAFAFIIDNGELCFDVKDANIYLYGSFSYPVAES